MFPGFSKNNDLNLYIFLVAYAKKYRSPKGTRRVKVHQENGSSSHQWLSLSPTFRI